MVCTLWRGCWFFVRPYRFRVLAAVAAFIAVAAAMLAFGQVFREVVDSGLKSGSVAALDCAVSKRLAFGRQNIFFEG